MIQALTTVIAVVLIAAVPLEGYVAWRFARQAWRLPRIDALTGAAVVAVGGFLMSCAVAVVSVHAIDVLRGGTGFLPTGVPSLLLAIGLLVKVLPNLYLLGLLRRWDRAAGEDRTHRRLEDPRSRMHRRDSDPR